MWIEDRTNGCTYDTFINQPIVKVNGVGIDGKPFRPGCEASAFNGDEIFRVKVSGYTAGQVAALTAFDKKPSKSAFFLEKPEEKDSSRFEKDNNFGPK